MATLAKSELDIALERLTPQWLAGFFDGEGCVSMTIHNNSQGRSYPRLMVNITQSDFHLLNLIAMKFTEPGGTGTLYRPIRKHAQREKRPIWIISFTGKNALPILEYIAPYVILKRKLVEWAIEVAKLTLERGGFKSATQENWDQRYALMEKIKSENNSGFEKSEESNEQVQ